MVTVAFAVMRRGALKDRLTTLRTRKGHAARPVAALSLPEVVGDADARLASANACS